MNYIKTLSLMALSLTATAGTIFSGDYKLNLYFGDSPPFTDTIHVSHSQSGLPSGTMHVPNDFDAILDGLTKFEDTVVFTVLVPKNASRPDDMVFRYIANIFAPDSNSLAGFVDLISVAGKPVTKTTYVGTFVGFRITQ